MAGPSVTYTFANSTTADATQVNTNFTDLINGATDGTKDYSINALTCAGTATLNGHVALGSASNDDLTVNASLASTIPIKTTNSYDIGSSTLGLRALFFGANSQTVKLQGSSSMSATWTFTFPVTAGTIYQVLETDGSGVTSWNTKKRSSDDIQNVAISAAVAANALTITLTTSAGAVPSATDYAHIMFRSGTQTVGTATARLISSTLTLTISSGSTLGHLSGQDHYIYVYAIDNSGTVELAATSTPISDENDLYSTTAEGGAGGADSASVIYSTTARANVAMRLIGRLRSNQATAGTWATAIEQISLPPFTKQTVHAKATTSTTTVDDAAFTTVVFSSTLIDTHNRYNTATGEFTVPQDGIYLVQAHVTSGTQALTANNEMQMSLFANGSEVSRMGQMIAQATANIAVRVHGSTTRKCVVGDVLTIRVIRDGSFGAADFALSGGATVNWVSFTHIGFQLNI